MDETLGVRTIDGKKVEGVMRTMNLQLLPGTHRITLFYGNLGGNFRESSKNNQSVKFKGMAGKEYHIHSGYNKEFSTWDPYIVEK